MQLLFKGWGGSSQSCPRQLAHSVPASWRPAASSTSRQLSFQLTQL